MLEIQPPPAFPRRPTNNNPSGAGGLSPAVASAVPGASTVSASTQTTVRPSSAAVPAAALLIESGYAGIQYALIDPSNQYQKYLIVKIQAPSGTDPLNPPNFNAVLIEGGRTLELTVPVSSVFSDANLLVHRNATWMNEAVDYETYKQTRLGGLGPAIAQVNTYFSGQPWSTVWRLPLAEPCEVIVGNYSITNFPTRSNFAGQKFYPVVVEFKLKTVEQSVKGEARINTGVWKSDDESDDSDDFSYLKTPVGRKRPFSGISKSL